MKRFLLFALISFAAMSGANAQLSAIQKKYTKKIVFANTVEAIAKDAEKESEFVTQFVLGSQLYFRAYLSNPLTTELQKLFPDADKLILNVQGRYRIKFILDGMEAYSGFTQPEDLGTDAKDTWLTFKGALNPSGDDLMIGQEQFRDFVATQGNKLTTGNHKFTMQLFSYTMYPDDKEGPLMASGDITLVVKNNSIDVNDEKMCLPKAVMNDKALEEKILKAFKAKGWKEQPKLVRIISSKWDIQRNENTGVVERRTVDAVVASTLNGKCISQIFSFAQDFDGTGYQQEVYLYGTGGQQDINCKCLQQ